VYLLISSGSGGIISGEVVMELDYTYWQEPSGMYLGYLNIWTEHWTQGRDVSELEEMLADLYEIYLEDQKENSIERMSGKLKVAVAL
jgi:predicted RNase H-like HicB family nuclease